MFLTIIRIIVVFLITIPLSVLALFVIPIDRSGKKFHSIARFWARSILRICQVKIELQGVEHLDSRKNFIYVSNHASAFDIPAVLAGIPDEIRIVLKKELTRVPIWGWALKHGPYISIDREKTKDAMGSLDRAAETIKTGASVLLFGEGTRSRDGNLLPFKRGAFALAAKSGVPIIPVTINNSFKILPKGSLNIRPTNISLVLDRPIETAGRVGREEEKRLMETVYDVIAKNYVPTNGEIKK